MPSSRTDIRSGNGRRLYQNLSSSQLVEIALQRAEGRLASTGALVVETGKRTGRSPRDRFIVKESSTQHLVDWGAVNQAFDPSRASALWDRVSVYLADKDVFMSDLHVGAHPEHYQPVQVSAELAWHSLFASALFIHPDDYNPLQKPVWQVLSAPGFVCDPQRDGTHSESTLILDFARRRVLLAGMR